MTDNSDTFVLLSVPKCEFTHCLIETLINTAQGSSAAAPSPTPDCINVQLTIASPHARGDSSTAKGNEAAETEPLKQNDEKTSTASHQSHDTALKLSLQSKANALSSGDSCHCIPLAHASRCPFLHELAQQRANAVASNEGQKVTTTLQTAVCVLLVDERSELLFTRRPPHMRAFPKAWVVPGGKVDPNERLIDAAAREVREETGLLLNPDQDLRPLCMWESVFPTHIEYGVPKSHIIILYFFAKLPVSFSQLLSRMTSTHTNSSSSADSESAASTADSTGAGQQSEPHKQQQQQQQQSLRFSTEEVDAALSLPLNTLAHIATRSATEQSPIASPHFPLNPSASVTDSEPATNSQSSLPIVRISKEESSSDSIAVSSLIGIYPNQLGGGIAEGHLFAGRVLASMLHQ